MIRRTRKHERHFFLPNCQARRSIFSVSIACLLPFASTFAGTSHLPFDTAAGARDVVGGGGQHTAPDQPSPSKPAPAN